MRISGPVLLAAAGLIATAAVAQAQTASEGATPDGTYDAKVVGIRRVPPLERGGSVPVQSLPSSRFAWDAFEGADHHAIPDEEFFQIVGREDLLSRYRHRRILRKALMYSAWPLIVGGLTFATLEYSYRNESDENLGSPRGVSPGWGLGIASAGVISLVVGYLINPKPIPVDEADAAANEYNRSLRLRLGLPEYAPNR